MLLVPKDCPNSMSVSRVINVVLLFVFCTSVIPGNIIDDLSKSIRLRECFGSHIIDIFNKCKFEKIWFYNKDNVKTISFHNCDCYPGNEEYWKKVVCYFL